MEQVAHTNGHLNLAGKTIKGYELQERIGAGGFGAVYRAHQSTVGREVAMKIILPHFASHPEFIRRFETEAQLVARLEHIHIIPLYDYWRDPDGAYLIMRYLRGGSLRDVLQNNGAFDLQAAAVLLDQIATALATAHRANVIHRDLKPGNILLDEEGNAYLADFGIAKDVSLDRNITEVDAVVGSPDYLAPEQARSEPVTPHTDIYSLGVVLYEMLTGEHPFPKLNAIERLFKHLNEPLPDIATLPDALAYDVNAVIQKATSKDPMLRYQDALEMAAAFRQAIKSSVSLVETLTQREHEILRMIIDGRSNKEIAQTLFVSIATVKWHITQIYGKLGVRSRVQAIVRARELDLIAKPQTIIEIPARIPTEDFHPDNPYKGLRAFQSADYQDFFGREKLVDKLIKRLAEVGAHRNAPLQNDDTKFARFLAVIGPSGSGKSSLVKAGLIPALWRGDIPASGGVSGSEKWFIVEMLPGAHPLDELEIALTRVAANQSGNLRDQLVRDERGLVRAAQLILPDDGSELVLVIDQFEEMFTLVENEAVRVQLLELLHAAVTDPRSRVRVIVTLRADFYDRPLYYPQFGELLRSRMETVLPLSADGLERAISKPAERVGLTFEPGLVASIISEINYQPGALPLLQYALTELFEQRQGRLLTHEAYHAIGKTTGALARRADSLYNELSDEGKAAARQMFLRLVTLGEGTEDTRRRASRAELLTLGDSEIMEEVIDTYGEYRLLAFDNDPGTREPTVEVAHEAILREWERLREWLNANREEIRLERQLAQAAHEWETSKREASFLLRGARLETFEKWASGTDLAMTPSEHAFLDASIAARKREQELEITRHAREVRLERRSRNTLRGLVAVFAIAALLSAGLSVFAFGERNRAESNTLYARSIALAAAAKSAHLTNSPDQAIALAVAANTTNDNPPAFAQSALFEAAFAPATRRAYKGQSTFAAALSPDGRRALSWRDRDSSFVYWNIETGQIIHQGSLDEGTIIDSAVFASNGETAYVAIYTSDYKRVSVIEVEVATGKQIRRFAEPDGRHAVGPVALSPDGQTLFTASGTGSPDAFVAGPIYAWDVASGSVLRQFDETPLDSYIWPLTLSQDGQQAIAGYDLKGTVVLWDVTTGKPIRTIKVKGAAVPGVHITSEGIVTLAVQLEDFNTILTLWDKETGNLLREQVWPNPVNGSDLHPDRSSIALAFFGAPVTVLDLQTWQKHEFYGHGNTVLTVEFSPDGRSLLSASYDGDLRLWNLVDGSEIKRLTGLSEDHLVGFTLSPDGRTALSQQFNGPMTLWDLETGKMIRQLGDTFNSYAGVFFSPDGRYLVSGSTPQLGTCPAFESKLTLRDAATGEIVWEVSTEGQVTTGKAFINNSTQIVTVDWNCSHNVTIWDAATGQKLNELEGHQETSWGVTASHDGKMFVTASEDNTAIVWDSATGSILHTLPHDDAVRTSVFSPDGRQLLTAVDNGVLHLWDTSTWQELKQMGGHSSSIIFMQFSPDGKYVVSSGRDNNIFVWDLQTAEVVRHFHLTQVSPMGHIVAFSPDSQSLYMNDENNHIRQVDLMLEPGELLSWVYANRYIRELTCSERQLYRLEPICDS